MLLIAVLLVLGSCGTSVEVISCPSWLEVGTASRKDTETTKRWMYRYEVNRQRECGVDKAN